MVLFVAGIATIVFFILFFAIIFPLFFENASQKENAPSDEIEGKIRMALNDLEKAEEEFTVGKITDSDYRLITNEMKKKLIALKEKALKKKAGA